MHSINRVRDFHEKFNHPIAVDYQSAHVTKEMAELRINLVAEELCELCDALGMQLQIINVDGEHIVKVERGYRDRYSIKDVADALGDLDYVVQGANLVFGIPAEDVAQEIHRSNMSKLGIDGNPIYRADGKILKGPNYFKPNLDQFFPGKKMIPFGNSSTGVEV